MPKSLVTSPSSGAESCPNSATLALPFKLSDTHLEVLTSLQTLKDRDVRDVVISVCAAAWSVEKGLIEEWLGENRLQGSYAPPTPVSLDPSSPPSSSKVQENSATPLTRNGQNHEQVIDEPGAMLLEQLIHEWPTQQPVRLGDHDSSKFVSASSAIEQSP